MKTFFISDLHLSEAEPAITACFLRFLENEATQAEALYILGDFFEVWVGDDNNSPLEEKIVQALKKLTSQGVKIYFMHGNRDFLLGEKYATRCGMQILKDPTLIDLYNKQILLMHGDSLCTDDISHQRFRYWMNKPIIQKILLSLPLATRHRIANYLRRKSQQHGKRITAMIQDVTQLAVEKYMTEYKTTLMIHGHTHRPAVHEFMLNGQPAKRIVLAAWHDQGSALCFNDNGKMEVLSLPIN